MAPIHCSHTQHQMNFASGIYPVVPLTPSLEGTRQLRGGNAKSPGTRCPNCLAKGNEVWVVPGLWCRACGMPVDGDDVEHPEVL